MGTVGFTQKTYPLGAEQAVDCDKALALADSIEDEELQKLANSSESS
jgi:hypothetical protein